MRETECVAAKFTIRTNCVPFASRRCSNYGISDRENLDYGRFRERITGAGDYDIAELASLLRKDQRPDLEDMVQRVVDGFRFPGEMTELEKSLTGDDARRRGTDAEALRAGAAERADRQ